MSQYQRLKACADCGREFVIRGARSQRCDGCQPGHRRKVQRDWHARHLREHPNYHLLRFAKARAKKYDLEFSLSEDDISVPDACPILGIPLIRGIGKPVPGSPTIDRIDSTGGYTPDNVQVISWRANTLKKDANTEELIKLGAWATSMRQKIKEESGG